MGLAERLREAHEQAGTDLSLTCQIHNLTPGSEQYLKALLELAKARPQLQAFLSHAQQEGFFNHLDYSVIPNYLRGSDRQRFRNNPHVVSDPHIMRYSIEPKRSRNIHPSVGVNLASLGSDNDRKDQPQRAIVAYYSYPGAGVSHASKVVYFNHPDDLINPAEFVGNQLIEIYNMGFHEFYTTKRGCKGCQSHADYLFPYQTEPVYHHEERRYGPTWEISERLRKEEEGRIEHEKWWNRTFGKNRPSGI